MTNPPIFFHNEDIALQLIAGLPCGVRAFDVACRVGLVDRQKPQCLMAGGGWRDPIRIEREILRLYPGLDVQFASFEAGEINPKGVAIDGLNVCAHLSGGAGPLKALPIADMLRDGLFERSEARIVTLRASRSIIRQTGKPTDGLVSEWINRPISQFLSAFLLRLPWIRPIHATIAAGLIGVIMAICLFWGGNTGLIAGAILFQTASIVDGVDGEIARATQRSSKLGATLDTACDALTNFAFIAGVSVNLLQSGQTFAGWSGLGGLALLFAGLIILGGLSLRAGGPLSFDALKHKVRAAPSPVMTFLAKITSRDVYALVLALMIVIGLAAPALVIFAIAIAIWFAAAMAMVLRMQLNV